MAWEDDPNPEYDDEEVEHEDDSSDGRSTSPSPEPVASSLNAAIRDAPISQLREVLTYICDHNDSARRYADSRLLTPISGNGIAADAGRKRKRFEKCRNCDVECSLLTNEKGDCVYHPGVKEISDDDDFWADHDDDVFGNRFDLADEPDYEDGFKWTCWDRTGGEDGCVVTKHKAAVEVIPEAKQVRTRDGRQLVGYK